MLDRIATLWRRLLTRGRASRELDEELQFHLDMETQANIRRGMAPSEARRSALREFGGTDRTRELVRDVRGFWFESVVRDIAYAFRWFRRDTVVSASTVAAIGLSVGLATAIYSVAESVLLRPFPYQHPEELLSIWRTLEDVDFAPLPPADLIDLRANARTLWDVAGMERDGALVMTDSVTEWADAYRVTPNLFDVLGVRPVLGRVFDRDEDRPGHDHVAVITERFWKTALLGDAGVIGRRVRVKPEGSGSAAAESFEVVGVVRAGVRFNYPRRIDADIFIPRTAKATDATDLGRSAPTFFAIARVKPGMSVDTAMADVSTVLKASNRAHPGLPMSDSGVRVASLHEELVGRARPTFLLLGAAAMVLLLVGSSNVANLLLAAGLRRAPEMATRLALGCSRRRLVRQLLTENGLLAGAGGLLGFALACSLMPLLVRLAPSSIPRVDLVSVNMRVLVSALAITACVAVLATVAPAVAASRPASQRWASSRSTGRRSWAEGVLVSGEAALMLTLTGMALLIGHSAWRLANVPLGFEPSGVAVSSIVLPERVQTPVGRADIERRILGAMRDLPGVRQVSISSELPFTWGVLSGLETASKRTVRVVSNEVDPSWFSLLRVPVLRGRALDSRDAGSTRVALVSQSLAAKLGGEALGQQMRIDGAWRDVVGVVGDVTEIGTVTGGVIRRPGLDRMTIPAVYLPLGSTDTQTAYLLVRSEEPLSQRSLTRRLRAVDPEATLKGLAMLDERVAAARAEVRFSALVLIVFAAAALSLCAIGFHATLLHAVAQRTREIGVRIALGASPWQVQLGVAGRVGVLVLVGGICGAGFWRLGAQAARRFLFEVAPSDAWTLAGAVAALALVTLLSCWRPARRASRLDPTMALRLE